VSGDPEQTEPRDQATKFVELLTSHQRDLYSYISSLLIGHSSAADVLQETNLDLWSRLGDFDFNRPFLPWAYGFAYQRVLAFRKSQRRSRLVISDEIVQLISDAYVYGSADADVRLGALRVCVSRLDHHQRNLIHDRYMAQMSVKTIATRLGSTANQVSARLYRIRKALAKCIESALARESRLDPS
jgi:RNA polymerase sigma-70 factor, ECF subfamily